MAKRIESESADKDVVIVCTGSAHSNNIAKRLGLAPQDRLIISNESDMIDALGFDVDAVTFEASIPEVAEEKLAKKQTELQASKTRQSASLVI